MSSNNDNSENDSNSEENVYTKSFFYQNRGRSSYSQSMNNQRNSDKNDAKTYSSDRSTNENFRDFDDTKRTHRTNERNSWFSRDSHNERSNFDNGDSRSNNTTDREQNCIIQCFFDELNIVDHRGFPERDLVISVMSQNIQDSELKDFVEESIIECYRYLVSNKRNKCEFSQNLLTCLAEKGQKECDDWED
ncbi:odorant-binding protein 59a isoform X2 [Calliopsis andreniformis]|uniref:odorant-binding protein 59a isoform X2 n=1 Tax=Calliopsis andreniformis TaxID=337506 RepID=UPI003FCD0C8F